MLTVYYCACGFTTQDLDKMQAHNCSYMLYQHHASADQPSSAPISDMLDQLMLSEPWRYLGPAMADDVESASDWCQSLRGLIGAVKRGQPAIPELLELPDRK